MALERYRCSKCGEIQVAFEDEMRMGGNCGRVTRWCHRWEKVPTTAKVVMATSLYMQDFQLDSWSTVYELDRLLNIEVQEEKETKVYQEFIKNA